MRRLTAGLMLCGAILTLGCSDVKGPRSAGVAEDRAAGKMERGKDDFRGKGNDKDGPRADKADQKAPERKIVYTATVETVVEDMEQSRADLRALLKEHKGYVAHSDETGKPGKQQRCSWTLRVPVATFDDFLAAIGKLGELQRRTLGSDDVTDRYHDTAAEVTNLEAREKALRKLFEEKIGGTKLSDLLDVDRELSNVRGQINQRKGMLQRWDKETAFATITLTMQELKDFKSPTAPDFGTSISRTWEASLEMLVAAGKGLVLTGVAMAPWLVVLLVVLTPLVVFVRRLRKR